MNLSLPDQTLRVFTALRLVRTTWSGVFMLGIGLRADGQALALASLAAGAASLFLESDSTAMRAAQRRGCCTFHVTTLDEALRALRNELRQRRAITVGLAGDPDHWLAEMVERGVLPAVVAAETFHSMPQLIAWGAQPIHGFDLAQLANPSTDLDAFLNQAIAGKWRQEQDAALSLADRRARDSALAANYVSEEPIAAAMRRWLRIAPSLFPRDTVRSLWIRQ